jgi:hypothetical protein
MEQSTEVDAAVLPSQFYDLVHRNTDRSPEAKLCLAVLEDAVVCLLQNKTPMCRIEAADWVRGRPSLLSFESVCEALGLNDDTLRERLLQLAGGGQEASRSGLRRRRCRLVGHAARVRVMRFS